MTRRLLSAIIVTYAVLALAYAYATPAWQNPDEPAHYNYAREIADHTRLPILSPGDYDQDRLERLKASKFAGAPDVSWIRYESYQPPLYYALGATVISLTPGRESDLYAMRLLSVLLGALVLIVIFVIGREVVPEDPAVALGATALVAFIPQHLAMSAAANNDALGELLLALMALLSIRRAKGALPAHTFTIAGAILFGLALLTKVTAYTGVAILAAGELVRWALLERRRSRFPWGVALGVIGGGLLIGGWWFVRNALTYGNLDILGLARHDQVVVGQPRTEWSLDTLRHLATTTFQSFWAQFGWMGVLVDVRIYWLLALLTGTALIGSAFVVWQHRMARPSVQAGPLPCRGFCPWQWWALGLLALQFALIAGVMLFYNMTFLQPQGRYLFGASAAIGVFFALGLREVIDRPRCLAALVALGCAAIFLIGGGKLFLLLGAAAALGALGLWKWARRVYRPLVWAGLATALAALDVVCLVVFIVPALAV